MFITCQSHSGCKLQPFRKSEFQCVPGKMIRKRSRLGLSVIGPLQTAENWWAFWMEHAEPLLHSSARTFENQTNHMPVNTSEHSSLRRPSWWMLALKVTSARLRLEINTAQWLLHVQYVWTMLLEQYCLTQYRVCLESMLKFRSMFPSTSWRIHAQRIQAIRTVWWCT